MPGRNRQKFRLAAKVQNFSKWSIMDQTSVLMAGHARVDLAHTCLLLATFCLCGCLCALFATVVGASHGKSSDAGVREEAELTELKFEPN